MDYYADSSSDKAEKIINFKISSFLIRQVEPNSNSNQDFKNLKKKKNFKLIFCLIAEKH